MDARRSARFPCHEWTPALWNWCGSPASTVVSSGDLVQRFSAVWRDAEIASHMAASPGAVSCEGSGVRSGGPALRDGVPTTSMTSSRLMAGWFREEGSSATRNRWCRHRRMRGIPLPSYGSPRAGRSARGAHPAGPLGQTRPAGRRVYRYTWVGLPRRRFRHDRLKHLQRPAARDAAVALVQTA
jgi:hypothetical protein